MRKFLSLLLVFCISFLTAIPSFATTTIETQVARLQELGFPQEFLESITDQDIHKLYEKSRSGILQYGGKSTSLLYTDDDISLYGTIPSADMQLDVHYIPYTNSSGEAYTEIIIYVNYRWTTGHPEIRRGDGVAVNWDSSLFYTDAKTFSCSNSARFQNTLINSNSSKVTSALSQGGLGYSVDFPHVNNSGDDLVMKYTFSGSASFSLYPTSTMYSGNNRATTVNVEYCHNKTPVLGSVGFIYKGVSVAISSPVLSDSVANNCVIRYGEATSV